MFRKNKQDQQSSLFDSQFLLPPKLRQKMEESWAHTFYHEVFLRIPEESFAFLYSEADSRPNAPVNVLVGGDLLKTGFGWSDAELEENMQFDLLVRYALGLNNLNQDVTVLRTLYNFRRRVREYAQETAINLYQETFNAITDEQLGELALKTGWQRMDSSQLLSNIAQMSRLGLVLSVLQEGVSALTAAEKEKWHREQAAYLSSTPDNFCYRVKKDEVNGHLLQIGHLLLELVSALRLSQADGETLQMVERALQDLYVIDNKEQVTLRPEDEVPGSALQSPHDPEATYRKKGGKGHQGYVVNLSETCDPDNPVQLLTSVQLAQNTRDDGQLLKASLEEQCARGIRVEKVTVDGGYTGKIGETACREHGVQMLPTRIRGGRTSPGRWGWEEYTWLLDDNDRPRRVVCPRGQTAQLAAGRRGDWLLARFERSACTHCPFYRQQCRVKPYPRKPPTLLVKSRWVQVALLRQGMSPGNYALRAGIESTVRSFKHVFPAGKLPVRRLIRSGMVVCCSALMVNFRRLHQFRMQYKEPIRRCFPGAEKLPPLGSISWIFFDFLPKIRHFLFQKRAKPLATSKLAYSH